MVATGMSDDPSGELLHGRWYGDACGASFAMEIIGERWTMHVMRELMLGPLRFSALRSSLPGISAKVLTERLARLESAGALVRRRLPPHDVQVYELTEWGYRAEPLMAEMGRWSVRSPLHDPTLPLTPVAAMLSLRAMFDPAAARGRSIRIGFDFGGQRFLAELADAALPIRREEDLSQADAVIRAAKAGAMLPFFYGKRDLDEVCAQTGLAVQGDRAAVIAFAALFSLPPKVQAPG